MQLKCSSAFNWLQISTVDRQTQAADSENTN